jgi:hypothetical protein
MQEVSLPSGAKLSLGLTPFSVSKALYQALLEEARSVKVEFNTDLDINLFKDLFISAATSPKVEACMWKCLERCLYNGQRITEQTFEPVETRKDYIQVLIEVAKHNVIPFFESLRSAYDQAREKIKSSQT